MSHSIKSVGVIGGVCLLVALGGCSSSDSATSASASASSAANGSVTSPQGIAISDAYVKAAAGPSAKASPAALSADNEGATEMAMGPMSAAFMQIKNGTGSEVKLVSGETPIAGKVEIHETVNGDMQPIAGGLAIAPGATASLQPGGSHVMLMDLKQTLKVGEEVTLTLNFSNGEKVVLTAPVKDAAGGTEPYSSMSASS